MAQVVGIDSSTQSTKVALYDADDGQLLTMGTAPHPDGTSVAIEAWRLALEGAGQGILDRCAAIGVGGQQHGMVLLDDAGQPVHDALLWNDNRSAADAVDLIQELGGAQVGRRPWARCRSRRSR